MLCEANSQMLERKAFGYLSHRVVDAVVAVPACREGGGGRTVGSNRTLASHRPVCQCRCMARPDDIPQPTRDAALSVACPSYDTTPFVAGPPLARRRIAVVSSAALIKRGDQPFPFGSGEVRFVAADTPPGDLLISHVSINFDRTGWQRDINVVFPIDRLRELAASGEIGGVADTHYTVMGSTDPAAMDEAVEQIAGQLRQERIDSVLLSPV
jgi:D-proline reductase (dithiol) PrdB